MCTSLAITLWNGFPNFHLKAEVLTTLLTVLTSQLKMPLQNHKVTVLKIIFFLKKGELRCHLYYFWLMFSSKRMPNYQQHFFLPASFPSHSTLSKVHPESLSRQGVSPLQKLQWEFFIYFGFILCAVTALVFRSYGLTSLLWRGGRRGPAYLERLDRQLCFLHWCFF